MPHDQPGRRSRFKRTPTGKRVFLTERDLQIFRLLYRYRYLRATQLVAFLQPKCEKRLIERLGDLYHETELVDRPTAQWRRFDARYAPIVYELSGKGFRFLEAQGLLPDRAVTFAGASRAANTPQFEHAMMIVDALVEAETEVTRVSDQRFVPIDEILKRAPTSPKPSKHPLAIPTTIRPGGELPTLPSPISTEVVPDALYGIEYIIDGEKRYRFFALECENTSPKKRSSTKLSSLNLKLAAYTEIFRSKAFVRVWGIPNLALRVVNRQPTAMGIP